MNGQKREAFTGGGIIATALTVDRLLTSMMYVIGILGMVLLLVGGICIWPYFFEIAMEELEIKSSQLFTLLIVDCVCSLVTSMICFYASIDSGKRFFHIFLSAILTAQVVCMFANGLVMLCMQIGIIAVKQSMCGKVLAFLGNGVCCLLLSVLPSFVGGIIDTAVIAIRGFFRHIAER